MQRRAAMRCSVALRASARVSPGDHVRLEVVGELLDLGGCRLVEPASAPVFDDPVPIGAVDATGAIRDGHLDHRDVLGEGRRGNALLGGGQEVGRGDAESGEQPGGVDLGRARPCLTKGWSR
jgi:hypothetical protein